MARTKQEARKQVASPAKAKKEPAQQNYASLTVVKLKDLLKKRGLNPKGNKKDLVAMLEEDDVKEEETGEDVEEEEEVEEAEEEADEEVEEEEAEEEVEEEEAEEEAEEEEEEEDESEEEEPEPPKPEIKSSKSSLPKPKKSFRITSPSQKSPPKKEEENLEGFFGTKKEINFKLCENRQALETFSPKSEEEFQDLTNQIFNAKDYESLRKIIVKYASFPEKCDLTPGLKKAYVTYLDSVAAEFIELFKVDTGILEPKFDSALGVYRIGSYAIQQDPENSTALVFGYILPSKGVVPLTDKTIKECPKEFTLYHEYHRKKSPPSAQDIKKIIGDVTYPKLPIVEEDSEAQEDGLSYPNKFTSSDREVARDLVEISVPEPSKKAFMAYRKAQRKLKSANAKKIAEEAGISTDDALYIASHFLALEKKYHP